MEQEYFPSSLSERCRDQTDLPWRVHDWNRGGWDRLERRIPMEQYFPSALSERCRDQTDLPWRVYDWNRDRLEVEDSKTLGLLEEETTELEQRKNDKQQLETHIGRYPSIVSAHRKLPVELWEDIFAIVCSHGGYSLSIGYTSLVMSPITLTHVCSRWRVIVTGCPRLWASICVGLNNRLSSGARSLVQTFLANSGACALDLQINVMQTQTTWEILMRHVSRSKRLHLNFYVDNSLAFQDITFNNLSSFLSSRLSERQLDINGPFCQALRQAPKLKKVELGFLWHFNSLPYSQLTALTIDHVYLDEVDNLLQVLEVSVNLRFLDLHFRPRHDNRAIPNIIPRRMEMPSLRTLFIGYNGVPVDDPTLDVLFSSLVMPGLLTLELLYMARSYSPLIMTHWPATLLTILQRSSMTLRDMSLTLAHSPIYYDSVWDPLSILLETVPHLTHFKLDNITASSCSVHQFWDVIQLPSRLLLTELTYVSHKSPILPELETVSIHGIRLDHDTLNAILTLAASRSPRRLSEVNDSSSVRPLRELHIVHCVQHSPVYIRALQPRMLEAIEDLAREGVKVVIE